MLEETNVSDGPPVEHSIMKRAWPYALALAVVVTGCYLALAPLLRSLSPAPTTSAASPLTRGHNVTTIGKSKGINVVRSPRVTPSFVANLKTNTKKTTTKKTTTKKKAKKSTVTTPTATTGFATNQTSTSTTPSTITKTPKKSSSTPTKTASKAKGASVVGGKVDATPTGGGGFATGGGDSGSSDFGQSSNVGP
jgi:hypothetical protein